MNQVQKKIVILSDGKAFRPLIDVEDMCKSIHWALFRKKDKENYLAINVGRNENNIRIIDLARKVAKIIPGTKVVFSPSKKSDARSYKVDFSAYKKRAPKNKITKSINRIILELYAYVKKNMVNKRVNYKKYIRLKNLENKIKKKKLSRNLFWIQMLKNFKLEKTFFKDLIVVKHHNFNDDRGSFSKLYSEKFFFKKKKS